MENKKLNFSSIWWKWPSYWSKFTLLKWQSIMQSVEWKWQSITHVCCQVTRSGDSDVHEKEEEDEEGEKRSRCTSYRDTRTLCGSCRENKRHSHALYWHLTLFSVVHPHLAFVACSIAACTTNNKSRAWRPGNEDTHKHTHTQTQSTDI